MGKAEERLAQWIVETKFEDIPPEAVRTAQEAVFDGIGVALAGSTQPVGKIIHGYAREMGGTPESTVIAGGFKTSALQAALTNGTVGHALDYDDLAGGAHLTPCLLPAVLALGERAGKSGKDVLEAYIIGFEVASNLRLAGRFMHEHTGFHATGVLGTIAATAASAKLLGLSPAETVMAFGSVASMASGISQNVGTMTKPLHAGLAARNGVMAAELACRGFTATDMALESRTGWASAFYGEAPRSTRMELVKNLGKPFTIQSEMLFKKYPCCYEAHPMLDALLGLLKEHNIRYDDVESVEVGNEHFRSPMLRYRVPQQGLEGKFSMVYNAAIAILDGAPTIEHFSDERVRDPRLLEAMSKVRVEVVSRWDERSEQPFLRENPVTVHMKDGRVFTKGAPPPLLGSPQKPWAEGLEAKFRENASRALPKARVDEVARVWRHLAEVTDIRKAMTLIADVGTP